MKRIQNIIELLINLSYSTSFALLVFTVVCLYKPSNVYAQVNSACIYMIGNSLTDDVKYYGFKAMAESRGKSHTWSRHMIPGSPLFLLWRGRDGSSGFFEDPYGPENNAFANYTWDAITLQPYARHLVNENNEGDSIICANYANLAKGRSPNVQFYIYNQWHATPMIRVNGNNVMLSPTDPACTADKWNEMYLARYTGGWDATNQTRNYYERLTIALRRANITTKPFLMMPVGEVFYALNNKMKNGQVPGYTKIWQLYRDDVHVDLVGSFVAATTFFATTYKENPVGMAVPSQYGSINSSLVQIIQQTVWEVVTNYRDTNGNTWSGVGSVTIPVQSVSLDQSSLSLAVNQSFTLTPRILPTNATNQNVTWTTSDTNIATVSATGMVTGRSLGTTTITVRTVDGGRTSSCQVRVESSNIPVTGVTISPTTLTIKNGNSSNLSATVLPTNATNKNVTWSSSNTGVATVDVNGKVSSVAPGSSVITVRTVDGSKTATCSLTVAANQKPIAVISAVPTSGNAPLTVQFDGRNSYDLDAGDFVLGYDWDFGDGSGMETTNSPSHTYTSAGQYTARLRVMDNNSLRGDWVPVAITVGGGSSATTIIDNTSTSITYSGSWSPKSGAGWEANFGGTIQETNSNNAAAQYVGTFTDIQVIGSNHAYGSIVEIWLDGVKQPDVPTASTSTTYQAVWFSRSGLSNTSHTLRVVKKPNSDWRYIRFDALKVTTGGTTTVPVQSVSLNTSSLSFAALGATSQLTATVLPTNATNKNVSWSSNNTGVATVSSAGLVTATGAGQATITVTTQDGNRTATSSVQVTISGSGTTTTIDNASTSITYSGTWSPKSGAGWEGNINSTIQETNVDNSAAQYVGTFTGIQVIGSNHSNGSIAEIWLDGVKQPDVLTASATTVRQAVWFSRSGLTNTSHTIRVVKKANSDWKYLRFDALKITTGSSAREGSTSTSVFSQENHERIRVYPNPVVSNTMTAVIYTDEKTESSIQMISPTSQVFMERKTILEKGDNAIQIATEYFKNGLYLLIINKGNERIIKKVMIEK